MKINGKRWVEFLIACILIGMILLFFHTGDWLQNVELAVVSGIALAVIRIAAGVLWKDHIHQ